MATGIGGGMSTYDYDPQLADAYEAEHDTRGPWNGDGLIAGLTFKPLRDWLAQRDCRAGCRRKGRIDSCS